MYQAMAVLLSVSLYNQVAMNGVVPPTSVVGSAYASDAPVFEWADEAVAVNPHDRLKRLARERGWPVEDWG